MCVTFTFNTLKKTKSIWREGLPLCQSQTGICTKEFAAQANEKPFFSNLIFATTTIGCLCLHKSDIDLQQISEQKVVFLQSDG